MSRGLAPRAQNLEQTRASREKVGTGFSQKRCDNKQLEQDDASELAHLALGPRLTKVALRVSALRQKGGRAAKATLESRGPKSWRTIA
jgi:hypothetical protein